jgi:2-phospho-L-lactate guanylyltransferase (CobY/MobA/RfbA family)
MSKTKTYTLHPQYHGSSCLQHRLIRAAWAKGLTNITITWYSKKYFEPDCPGPGW